MDVPRGGRWRALLVPLLLVLLAQPVHAAPFLQLGVDAARTGTSVDAGPSNDDIALVVPLPGSRASRAPPLILGESVLVATADHGVVDPSQNAIVRVDLATGEVATLSTLPARPWALASDGALLFVAHEAAIEARTLEGARVWAWEHPRLVMSPRSEVRCVEPAVRDGTVYVACTEVGVASPTPEFAGQLEHEAAESRVFAVALDAATGAPRWAPWTEPLGREPRAAPSALEPRTGGVLGGAGGSSHADSLAVVGDLVLVVTLEGQLTSPKFWAVGADDGRFRWLVDGASSWTGTGSAPEGNAKRALQLPAMPTGRADVVFLRYAHLLEAVDPADADEKWLAEQEPALSPRGVERAVLALDSAALYVASDRRLSRHDGGSGARTWSVTMEDDYWVQPGLVVADGTLYGRTDSGSGDGSNLVAFDARDGTVRWSAGPFGTHDPRIRMLDLHFGIGEGVLAAATMDGSLVVVGTTAASIVPLARFSSHTPVPGAHVSVDLSASRAGRLGPPTSFRADWGDGTLTEWQASPRLTHVFGSAGEHTVRLFARNEAGQVASVQTQVAVGAAAPAPSQASDAAWPAALAALGLLAGAVLAARRWRPSPTATPPVDPFTPGARVLGRYRVERALGEGGFGRALLAADTQLDRRVVLKVLGAQTPRAQTALLAEARALARVRHANVVTIFDAASVEGLPVLVMEHVEGGSLKERLLGGPLREEERRGLANGLLDALAAVHAAGLVHGDVKPANVLLTSKGEAKLADFGVARALDVDATLSEAPTIVAPGTARYMSPEQARGILPTQRSDVYAAALTLFEAWTGEPYLGTRPNEGAAEVRLRAARPPAPEDRLRALPPDVARWLARALAPDPEDRYAGAGEMGEAFGRVTA